MIVLVLVGFDRFQYTVYNKNDYYKWHTDFALGHYLESDSHNFRKLSATLVLDDNFTGGEF